MLLGQKKKKLTFIYIHFTNIVEHIYVDSLCPQRLYCQKANTYVSMSDGDRC